MSGWEIVSLSERRPMMSEERARAMSYVDLAEARHDADVNGWTDDYRWPAVTAWDRAEDEPCQRGTVGCSVDHRDDEGCETW